MIFKNRLEILKKRIKNTNNSYKGKNQEELLTIHSKISKQ